MNSSADYTYSKIPENGMYCLYNDTKKKYLNIVANSIVFEDKKALLISNYDDAVVFLNSVSSICSDTFEIRQLSYEYDDVEILPKTYFLSDLVLDEIDKKYRIQVSSLRILSFLKYHKSEHNFLAFYTYESLIGITKFKQELKNHFNPPMQIKTKNCYVFCVYSKNLEQIEKFRVYNGIKVSEILDIHTLEWL